MGDEEFAAGVREKLVVPFDKEELHAMNRRRFKEGAQFNTEPSAVAPDARV